MSGDKIENATWADTTRIIESLTNNNDFQTGDKPTLIEGKRDLRKIRNQTQTLVRTLEELNLRLDAFKTHKKVGIEVYVYVLSH